MKTKDNSMPWEEEKPRNKSELAKTEIKRMLDNNEEVGVAELVRRTGLSRTFFYNNASVHEALLKAKEKQTGRTFVKPQEKILLYAMERQMQLCQGKMEELQQENEKLKQENERLRKIIQEQSLKIIKGL